MSRRESNSLKIVLGTGALVGVALLSAAGCGKQESASVAAPSPSGPVHPILALRALRKAKEVRYAAEDLIAAELPPIEFEEPERLKSSNGKLDVELRAQPTRFMLDVDEKGQRREQRAVLRTYGYKPMAEPEFVYKVTGPTLYVDSRAGDVQLNVKLCNLLGASSCDTRASESGADHGSGGDPNDPRHFQANYTNLHTHGLHVSPSGNSDNVFVLIEPGQYFDYSYKVPTSHAPGTHWYHAHHHGSTAVQLGNGMAGALIVAGGLDDAPGIKGRTDRIMVFQQVPWDNCQPTDPAEPYVKSEGGDSYKCQGTLGNARVEWDQVSEEWMKYYTRPTLVNGQLKPQLEMKPGEVERWRFLHAGISQDLDLRLCESEDTDCESEEKPGVPLYRIAVDGVATGKIQGLQDIYIGPGYRTDVLVKAPACDQEEGCEYHLIDTVSDPSDSIFNRHEQGQVLVVIKVKGDAVDDELPTDLSDYAAPYNADPNTDEPVEVVVYAPSEDLVKARCEEEGPDSSWCVGQKSFEECANGNTDACNGTLYNVNGRPFDANAVRKLTLGVSQKWSLYSDIWGPHPFHIHVNPFQLLDVSCKDPETDPLVDIADDRGLWRDTLLIQKGCTYDMLTKYTEFTGRFVQHCHILNHEDQGMMEVIEIVDPSSGAGP